MTRVRVSVRWRVVVALALLAQHPLEAQGADTVRSATFGRLAPIVRGIAIDARMAEDLGMQV